MGRSYALTIFLGIAVVASAVIISPLFAVRFLAVLLIIDGIIAIATKEYDFGDHDGKPTGFPVTGLIAQIIGIALIAGGIYLIMESGNMNFSEFEEIKKNAF